jgi:hypothetical protein
MADRKPRPYAERPTTPLGEETGITSAHVSEYPSASSTPRPPPAAMPDPYHFQPAIASSRPELSALRRNSSNYAQATAENLKFTSMDEKGEEEVRPVPGRSYSFSAEDLKRSQHEHLVKGQSVPEGQEGQAPHVETPGVGNSEAKGREYGFSTTE